jgi:hypothetical protein
LHSLKITEILKTFSVKELKEFEKFISSPFFSRGRNVVPIYKAVKKFYPAFNDKKYNKENIYRLAYKNKKFSSPVFRRLISDLTLLAEEYLRYLWFNSEGIEREIALACGYSRKKKFKLMAPSLKKLSQRLYTMQIDQDYFEYLYQLQCMYVHYYQCTSDNYRLHLRNCIDKGEFLVLNVLSRLAQILHDNFVLKHAYNCDYEENILNAFKDNFSIEGFINMVSRKEGRYNKIINFYSSLIKLYIDAEKKINNKVQEIEDDFMMSFGSLKEIYNELYYSERNLAGVILTTYCTLKINEGLDVFVKHIFELYKFTLQENILLYNGFIPYQIYLDYISKAIFLNKTEDAENFINEYTEKLNPEVKDLAYGQSMAMLMLNKKNFTGSLEILKKIKPFDLKNKCEIRILQAVNFYELGYYDTLEHFIETTLKMLEKNENITIYKRKIYVPFFSYLKKLIKLRYKNTDKIEAELLINNINSEKYFSYKKWLVEKFKEFV